MIQLLIAFQFVIGAIIPNGFKALESKNFDKAEACFRNAIERNNEPAVAYYGLALTYMNTENAHFQFDSAYTYAIFGENIFNHLSAAEIDKLQKRYKISSSKFFYLRRNISIDAFEQIDKKDTTTLRQYSKFYSEEKLAWKALQIIDEITIFANIPTDKDVSFYKNLISKYSPWHDQIDKVWKILYDKSTADGSTLSLLTFRSQYPDFPFKELLENDLKIAKTADKYNLLVRKTPQNCAKYEDYIRAAAPKYRAYQALTIYIAEYIDKKDWTTATKIAKSFAKEFGSDKYFNNLLELLSQPEEDLHRQPISDNINTSGHEFSPVMTANEHKIYFGGMNREDNLGGEDIFVSELKNGEWQKAKIVKSVSTRNGNEAPEAISIDENKLLMFANGDILQCEITENGWSAPKLFPTINTILWEGDGMLTADGKAIIFASEAWQKVGTQYPVQSRKDKFDIYISTRDEKGNWSEPQNLGTTINSPFCDRYPFLHPDMKTLYFSSEGHGGLGGSDVYMSQRLNDSSWTEWSEPINLGKNINSSGNDNGYKISTSGSTAYFSIMQSNIDIYTIDLPKHLQPQQVMIVEGSIKDINGNNINATIKVEDLETGEICGEYETNFATGHYTMTLPIGKQYGYYVSKKEYFPLSQNVDLREKKQNEILIQNFEISPIANLAQNKNSVRINNIFFETDKFELRHESYSELNRLAKFIIENSYRYKFIIEGHTDNIGQNEYNQILSENRAKAVMRYLIGANCPSENLSAKGFGANCPTSTNDNEEGRLLNRRVEIRIIEL